jgi:hypothetical protein
VAVSRPNGNATAAAPAVMTSVPNTSGNTPNTFGRIAGLNCVPSRNSPRETFWKKPTAGTASERTIPTVVSTDITAQARNAT